MTMKIWLLNTGKLLIRFLALFVAGFVLLQPGGTGGVLEDVDASGSAHARPKKRKDSSSGSISGRGLPVLERARIEFDRGEYEDALKMFLQSARGGDRGRALLGAARVLKRTGRYERARKLLRGAERDKRVLHDARTELARLDILTGEYDRAAKILDGVMDSDRLHFEARILRARLMEKTGNRIAANGLYRRFFTDLNNDYLSKKNPEHLLYLGMAAYGQEDWQEASNFFERASGMAPENQRVWLEWARLAVEKYRVDWADEFYKNVLKMNPNHPDALAGMAWVEWHAPRSNHHLGRERADKALEINAKCISAMLYLAGLDIFDARYTKADRHLSKAFAVNPNHSKALALKGAVHFLQDEQNDFNQVKSRALEINTMDGAFFNLAGRFVARHHRYEDAARLNKRALEVDPRNADALADLGINQLRTGEYGMGWFNLSEAYKLDTFNHKTVNLLVLRDALDKHYGWHKKGKIKFLFPKEEVKLLSRYVPQKLNKTMKTYMARYRYRPHIPVYMELYDKADDFQTRTFGEPAETGIMGVCFGKVVTSMSPSLGRTNWAYVLWHELAHVMHVQMTGGRVPRWFTEGLAEYETLLARPEWKRNHSRDLHRMLVAGNLTPVLELNLGFTRSKTMKGIIMAYFQSTFVIEFIHKRWGWDKILEALDGFAKGLSTELMLRQVLDIDPNDFDAAYTKYLEKRLSIYRGRFDPLEFTGRDVGEYLEEIESRLKKSNDRKEGSEARSMVTDRARAEAAMIYIMQRKTSDAKGMLEPALKTSPGDSHVRFAQSLLLRADREHEKERAVLETLIKDGYDSYEGRMRLAAMFEEGKQYKAAIRHLTAASKQDPEASEPLVKLAFLHRKLKQDRPLVDVLYRLAFLQHTSASIVYTAIKHASRLKRWDLVRKLGPLGIHNQPFNALIHEKYGWALRAAGKHEKALFQFESALMCQPDNKQYIHVGIARSHLALGRRKKAAEHADKALDVDPNFRPAIELLKKLRTYR